MKEVKSDVMGRLVVIAPSMKHVLALQETLGEKVSQAEPVPMSVFREDPSQYPDTKQLIYILAERPHKVTIHFSTLSKLDMFLAEDVFIIDNTKVTPLRDMTGCKWGCRDQRITSESALRPYRQRLKAQGIRREA